MVYVRSRMQLKTVRKRGTEIGKPKRALQWNAAGVVHSEHPEMLMWLSLVSNDCAKAILIFSSALGELHLSYMHSVDQNKVIIINNSKHIAISSQMYFFPL